MFDNFETFARVASLQSTNSIDRSRCQKFLARPNQMKSCKKIELRRNCQDKVTLYKCLKDIFGLKTKRRREKKKLFVDLKNPWKIRINEASERTEMCHKDKFFGKISKSSFLRIRIRCVQKLSLTENYNEKWEGKLKFFKCI